MPNNVWNYILGQCYKDCTIVNYDSRVILRHFPVNTYDIDNRVVTCFSFLRVAQGLSCLWRGFEREKNTNTFSFFSVGFVGNASQSRKHLNTTPGYNAVGSNHFYVTKYFSQMKSLFASCTAPLTERGISPAGPIYLNKRMVTPLRPPRC